MKLKKAERTMLDHIRTHGTPRGITLGRGRPNDRRVVVSLISKGLIWPMHEGRPEEQNEYAARGDEDANGLALIEYDGTVVGATWDGVRVNPLSDVEQAHTAAYPAKCYGEKAAAVLYPSDAIRREWYAVAMTREHFDLTIAGEWAKWLAGDEDTCRHGNIHHECNECMIDSDIAFDCAREGRVFGR